MRKELKILFIALSPFRLAFRIGDRKLSVNKKLERGTSKNLKTNLAKINLLLMTPLQEPM